MSLYPTLEDMKVDHLVQAQETQAAIHAARAAAVASGAPPGSTVVFSSSSLYPALNEYMGLSLTPEQERQWQVVSASSTTVATRPGQANVVAPVTAGDKGIQRAEIRQGLRQLLLCKDANGKIGLRVQGVSKGVFVSFVETGSPAALAGLRFGDQILEINDQVVAGWSTDRTLEFLRKASPGRITVIVRDRPFERTVTMNKDSAGYIGFIFSHGKISSIVKDSSAARNGLLIDHQLIEVNGQLVVGLKDKEVQRIIDAVPRTVTVTVMPCFVYDHIVKCLGSGLMKSKMDHSIPDV